jgi:hypothetical protein
MGVREESKGRKAEGVHLYVQPIGLLWVQVPLCSKCRVIELHTVGERCGREEKSERREQRREEEKREREKRESERVGRARVERERGERELYRRRRAAQWRGRYTLSSFSLSLVIFLFSFSFSDDVILFFVMTSAYHFLLKDQQRKKDLLSRFLSNHT